MARKNDGAYVNPRQIRADVEDAKAWDGDVVELQLAHEADAALGRSDRLLVRSQKGSADQARQAGLRHVFGRGWSCPV